MNGSNLLIEEDIDIQFGLPMDELSRSCSIPSYQSTIFLDGLQFNLLENEMNLKDLSNLQNWMMDEEFDTDALIEDIVDYNQSNLGIYFKDEEYFKTIKEYFDNHIYQHHCCTDETLHICHITNRIVKLLLLYQKYQIDEPRQLTEKNFIDNVNAEIFSKENDDDNECNIYDLEDMVNDYYHIQKIHEENDQYMQKLHKLLIFDGMKCNEKVNCNLDTENKREGIFGWLKLIHFHFVHWLKAL